MQRLWLLTEHGHTNSSKDIGFDTKRNLGADEHKHLMLGFIFLKYISDAFEERHRKRLAELWEGANPEDPDEYRAERVFWIHTEARWQTLQDYGRHATVGELTGDPMVERFTPYEGQVYDPFCRPACP